ncbi:MAG: bifunctional 5,10-methylene-tetrahydrofolate dehydrogenase/5,10-methylene-tetrahydrofolate cyclohydrolase, partial [Desulfobulbaceae bacterium]|nr:bifunctional 5,10-methylene-tetrahydrofolate dehydrogenase/5,10-methylene-tetrahydrofolate cyclohydrolase [Desulfobulbaceae bacterium]
MGAKIISGTETAKSIREELKTEVAELKEKHNVVPGLVTILVGADPASQVYVGAKEKTSKVLGIYSERYDLPEDTSEEDLLALVEKCNKNEKLHGILVQLPLPKHINEAKVLYAIDPDKDVDGFHPVNVGKMVLGEQCFLPCTPHGILELLERSGVETSGAETVVLGRSNIVGKPIANLMIQKRASGNATVTV